MSKTLNLPTEPRVYWHLKSKSYVIMQSCEGNRQMNDMQQTTNHKQDYSYE